MDKPTIRPYRDDDFGPVLRIWERSLPLDALSPAAFRNRVLLDPNRDPDGFLIAEDESGRAIGFSLCLVLRHPIEKVGFMPDRGFITAFGTDPEFTGRGVGSALLTASEDFFRNNKRKLIVVAPYVPNYFVPGIDRENYSTGLEFFKRRGFEPYSEAIAMDASIGTFRLDEKMLEREGKLASEGVTIGPLDWSRTNEFLNFMRETMPGDWLEDARSLLQRMALGAAPANSIQIVDAGGTIVGYCKFDGEHFGPFGVADSHQGRGLGTILLARTLLQMRVEGHHAAYVLWTGERAAEGVYRRLGFTVSRRFDILKKSIG